MIDNEIVAARLAALYKGIRGEEPTETVALPGAGSDRRYFRLHGSGGSMIGVYGEDVAENRAFVSLARYFREKGIAVPEVYAVSDDLRCYLQEDLGDVQLISLLHTPDGDRLVGECMRELARLQTLPAAEWEGMTFNAPFCRRQVMWDLNYFKYEYVKPSGVVFDESRLEDDFERLCDALLEGDRRLWGFMYRDCQSRNVMVRGDKPYWIDFQGGRVGPCVYDAVAMLWQAKAGFSDEFRAEMLGEYASALGYYRGVRPEEVLAEADRYVLFRTLQVLGAYGFRGLIQKRAHFIESIPGALANLRSLLAKEALAAYPELERLCRLLTEDERFGAAPGEGLRVAVFSFSYKRGYPEDFSGNGGGFMFDCRGLHNPGRYDEYKPLTGLDRPVRDFLEERGEIQPFLASAWQLTDQAVACYLRRGFTSLQIGFGCTGGRHRSVYSAEATARHIAEKFPAARVTVIHREQGIREEVKV